MITQSGNYEGKIKKIKNRKRAKRKTKRQNSKEKTTPSSFAVHPSKEGN